MAKRNEMMSDSEWKDLMKDIQAEQDRRWPKPQPWWTPAGNDENDDA